MFRNLCALHWWDKASWTHGTGGVWAWSEVRDSNINRNKEQPCTRKWGSREHDTFKTKRGRKFSIILLMVIS